MHGIERFLQDFHKDFELLRGGYIREDRPKHYRDRLKHYKNIVS